MRLLHISDLHFGPLYDPEVGEKLLQRLSELSGTTLIVTGDMTQRARRSQFEAAREWLDRAAQLVENTVVCPGNHDIALFRVWERVINPFALYREYISPDLDQVFHSPAVTVVALNSVRPLSRLVQGKLSRKQFRLTADAFAKSPGERLNVLAFHHPLITFQKQDHHPGLDVPWKTISGGERVDVVLTGHLHDSEVQLSYDEATGKPMVLISCGTSASRRGRGKDAGRNSFNRIEGSRSSLRVVTEYFNVEKGEFQEATDAVFDLTKPQPVRAVLRDEGDVPLKY
jgi:3',5'-cyclic AMP phosphodiesterase CpdA